MITCALKSAFGSIRNVKSSFFFTDFKRTSNDTPTPSWLSKVMMFFLSLRNALNVALSILDSTLISEIGLGFAAIVKKLEGNLELKSIKK